MVGPISIPWVIPIIIPLHIPIKPYKTAIYQQNVVHDSSITFSIIMNTYNIWILYQ